MAIGVVKGRSSVFLKEEVTEGVYVAPASSADAVEVLEDFAGFEFTREEIERSVLSDTVEQEASRLGLPTVSGEIPMELKAGATEGALPRGSVLYKSLMGAVRSVATASTTKSSGNTVSELMIQDADISKYSVNDVVLVKVPGAWQVRPIESVVTTPGAAKIVLAIDLDSVANSVVVAPAKVFYHAEGAPTVSASTYLGGVIEDQATGLRALTGELANWTTGTIPTFTFGTEGLGLDRAVDAPAYATDFSAEPQPPVALGACVWLNGVETDYTELGLSIENTKADIVSPCSPDGKVGSRITQFSVTGSVDPYMQDNSVSRFDLYEANADLSVFAYISNPGDNAGEIKNVVAFWLPQTKITSLTNADQDGVMKDQLEFRAYRKLGGDSAYISFI
jgi:hypothetical protein